MVTMNTQSLPLYRSHQFGWVIYLVSMSQVAIPRLCCVREKSHFRCRWMECLLGSSSACYVNCQDFARTDWWTNKGGSRGKHGMLLLSFQWGFPGYSGKIQILAQCFCGDHKSAFLYFLNFYWFSVYFSFCIPFPLISLLPDNPLPFQSTLQNKT